MNWRYLSAVLILLLFGLMILFSATQTSTETTTQIFYRQLIWVLVGFMAFVIGVSLSPRFLSFLTPFIYLSALLALVLVLILPTNATGTHRWLSLGFIRFQPSELAKLAVIFMLAHYFSHRTRPLERLRETLLPILISVVPIGLIVIEPDLGTALAFFPLVLVMLYWGGLDGYQILLLAAPIGALIAVYSWWLCAIYLVLLLIILVRVKADLIDSTLVFASSVLMSAIAPLLWMKLHDYQKQRIMTFLSPEKDPLGAGYQIIQSQVAIGSGGWFGKGYLEGSQKKLAFLPEQHTDFIFSVLGEELGLIGILFFLLLYGWILITFIKIAQETQNRYASYVVLGITVLLFTHVIVNVGMTLGVLPVVGLPLPLVSYGGSSLVITLFAIGLVFSIQRRRAQFF